MLQGALKCYKTSAHISLDKVGHIMANPDIKGAGKPNSLSRRGSK